MVYGSRPTEAGDQTRKDLVNYTHAEEYRVSLSDLLCEFNDARRNHLISYAVNERYKDTPEDLTAVCASISRLVNDKELFRSLYYTLDSDVPCDDPSRPSLD